MVARDRAQADEDRPPPVAWPAAELFRRLWDTSSDIIGVSATAVLVKRAVARAAPMLPAGHRVEVERLGVGYRYRLPAAWSSLGDRDAATALRTTVDALGPLLVELTGGIVVGRLAAEPALGAANLVTEEDLGRWRTAA